MKLVKISSLKGKKIYVLGRAGKSDFAITIIERRDRIISVAKSWRLL
jgi:hypothetical protein